MNPFGQRIRNPKRVVLLVEDYDGLQHGWEVFDATAEYQITDYPGGSAHGRVSVHGEFHRMKRAATLHPLEDAEYIARFGHSPRGEIEGGTDE